MEYICLSCGHSWDRDPTATYLQCPEPSCRSRDVVPSSFWAMVEEGRRRGVSHNTPILDIIDACQAVSGEESLLKLGFLEAWRVMRRVIKEIEHPRRSRIAVER